MSDIVQKIDNLLRLVSQPMSRGTGKTDALKLLARGRGARMIFATRDEIREPPFHAALGDLPRFLGTNVPTVVDHYAYEVLLHEAAAEIERLRKHNNLLEGSLKQEREQRKQAQDEVARLRADVEHFRKTLTVLHDANDSLVEGTRKDRAEIARLRGVIGTEINAHVLKATAEKFRGLEALGRAAMAGEWVKCACKKPYCQECRLRAALTEEGEVLPPHPGDGSCHRCGCVPVDAEGICATCRDTPEKARGT